MPKILKTLAVVIVALFAIAVIGMAAFAAQAPEESRFSSGGLERAVTAAEDANLTVTAVSPMDAYGEEYGAGFIACPGVTPEAVVDVLGLPQQPDGLPSEVDEDSNYLVLIREDGSSIADHMDRDRIDLCSGQQLPPFNAAQMVPLAKTTSGAWVLAQ